MNNAEALRMAADGKFFSLQYQDNSGGWADLSSAMPDAILKFARCEWADCWEFRLKPRTVKIGNREVEAPVLEPEEGQQVYFHGAWNSRNEVSVYSIRFSPKSNPRGVGQMRAKGLLFATEEACQAAHDAIHALLRGEA